MCRTVTQKYESALYIQLFRERLSEKVHATSPKRIVGAFRFNVFQKKFERMALEAMEYSCEC